MEDIILSLMRMHLGGSSLLTYSAPVATAGASFLSME